MLIFMMLITVFCLNFEKKTSKTADGGAKYV